jgi:predicted regulator of Ras-like GTPase activity (Roadblock/LC7/MglB family)
MAPEPRTIAAFFEKQLADLRHDLPSAQAVAIVSEDGCLAPDPVMQAEMTLHASTLRVLARAAGEPAAALGIERPRCLIVDATAGVLIVRPIATNKPRLLVLVIRDPHEVSVALNRLHRIAGEIEARLPAAAQQG